MKSKENFLTSHLREANLVSGQPKPSDTINNSGLGNIKRWLCGIPPFLGAQRFLLFGTEFHSVALERKHTKIWKTMDDPEKFQINGMHKSLMQCKIFTDNHPGAIIEKLWKRNNIMDIWGMHGTIDLYKKRTGRRIVIDLKTTSETTEEGFIKKAIKLSYPRQGVVYELLPDAKPADEVYFIGISKMNIGTPEKPIFPHFIFDLNNYAKEKRYAQNEAEFLLTFFSKYGLPIERKSNKTG